MNERITRIKNHVRENKKVYIGVAVGVGAGVAAGVVGTMLANKQLVIVDSFKIQVNSPTSNTVVTQLARRMHPGYIVRCNETGEVFASVNRAADVLGVPARNIRKHLKGAAAHVNGKTFEVLGEAQAA